MFNKKTDLNKLSRIRYSIDTELKLLNNKIEILYASKKINKNVLNEIKEINNNLQNNLQYLKLMIEYDDSEIEVLDDDISDKVSDKTEILDLDDYKTELLEDLTREIEILEDGKYKTELLDDLTREIEILDVSDSDEIEQLEFLENTISLNINSINHYINKKEDYSRHSEQLEKINKDLNQELVEVNIKLQNRIKILKIKRFIWTGIFVLFFIIFVVISCVLINRVCDNYKVDNQLKEINKYITYSDIEFIISSIEVSDEVIDEDLENILSSILNDKDNGTDNNSYNNLDNYHKYIYMNALSIDFNELKKINDDTKGWIKVDGTNINYPFVQTTDNKFYLKHSYDKNSTYMGWVFMDYRNSSNYDDRNTILYGHGLLNDTMFGSLRSTLKEDWYLNEDNHIIKLYTEEGFLLYQVFSNYTIEPESYYITTEFINDETYLFFLDTLRRRSVYDYNVELSANDKILTLSTCYDNQKRAVLHAKLIYSSY